MRAGFFTLLAVITAACSQLPSQQRDNGGGIIETPTHDYAVFVDDGSAVAVRMGSQAIQDDTAPAISAIRRATGCKVVADTITFDPKTVSAELFCPELSYATSAPKPQL